MCGDEPLQLEECCDAIRVVARGQGYSEREIMHVGTGFEWGSLKHISDSLSLFAQRRLLELRLASGKPGEAGGAALVEYASRPAQDTILLIISPKLEAQAQKSKWFAALEQIAAVIQVWPVTAAQLPAWITQRLRAKGMQASSTAAAMLAERVEGNLLAAVQDIEKLYLLYGATSIDEEAVTSAVVDSARFDIYELVDTVFQGDAARGTRILAGLRGEGVEPTLVLWALVREVRSVANMAYDCASGLSMDQTLIKHKVWEKRKGVVKQALQRHVLSQWQQYLRSAARIDRMIKGMLVGNVWDELLQLTLGIAGIRLLEDERKG